MGFQLWSEANLEAKKTLLPDLGIRSWNDLTSDEKYMIWKHLEHYFFERTPRRNRLNSHPDPPLYYKFFNDLTNLKKDRIYKSIFELTYLYKARNYAPDFLESKTTNAACTDFYSIFSSQPADVVLELLSLYCRSIIDEAENLGFSDDFRWKHFDDFAENLNDVFSAFGMNLYMTRTGFVPRQDNRIVIEIYQPVLRVLSSEQWKEVNTLLANAYSEYVKNTPQGYSTCVTFAVSSIQAYLQILVNGKTGTGDISKLIAQAQTKGLIPADPFTKDIFKNIESILMRERQETGIAHPPKEYATDRNARLVLNLTMIFFQHCMTF